jgi:hypothetical protein
LIACSPAVVAQLNRIKNFAGRAQVKSFQVPYHCDACTVDKLLLVHINDLNDVPRTAPECACDACGQPMTFADESGAYFAFLSHLPPPPKPQAAPEPALAKGSRKSITREDVSRISKPSMLLRESRPSLSVFQIPESKRPSEHTLPAPRVSVSVRTLADRPFLFALVTVLLCTVAVLAVMLIA